MKKFHHTLHCNYNQLSLSESLNIVCESAPIIIPDIVLLELEFVIANLSHFVHPESYSHTWDS